MKILETKHLKKYYGQGDILVKAVDDISISVEKGEFVAIVGTSGSGKTSLLNLLGGLDYADSGEVIIGGQSPVSYTHLNYILKSIICRVK